MKALEYPWKSLKYFSIVITVVGWRLKVLTFFGFISVFVFSYVNLNG